jgi:hypothetical protein
VTVDAALGKRFYLLFVISIPTREVTLVDVQVVHRSVGGLFK